MVGIRVSRSFILEGYNPVAWVFSGLFLFEAALLFWLSGVVHSSVPVVAQSGLPRNAFLGVDCVHTVSAAIAQAEGHAFPRLPTFGVPCPTTILTIGFLLAADRSLPRRVAVIPLVWAVIGGSAALLFGVRVDSMLLAAGIV